jgi:hypothetical protein
MNYDHCGEAYADETVTAALLREAEAAVKLGMWRTMKTNPYTFKDKMML